jgi:hypothetical protein
MQKMAKVSGKEKRYISENIKYKGAFLCPAYAVFFETFKKSGKCGKPRLCEGSIFSLFAGFFS